jgi:hypothetical protein
MRFSSLIAALAVAAPLGLCAGPASAQFFQGQSVLGGRLHGPQGAWCARNNNDGAEEMNCSFNSFEACNREARLSNGFCTQNFSGGVQPVRRSKGDRERR